MGMIPPMLQMRLLMSRETKWHCQGHTAGESAEREGRRDCTGVGGGEGELQKQTDTQTRSAGGGPEPSTLCSANHAAKLRIKSSIINSARVSFPTLARLRLHSPGDWRLVSSG